ncbi:MAG: hypothetical protein KGD57_09670 [Candidatus Lokiarchaeota archaeon]|nr:hypothetical protein [Candidatus Lokiarchaeota archaeon]
MSDELDKKLKLVEKYFETFSTFIELDNFRDFLLFTLNSQVSSNILAQLGIGGSKEIINLPYNPLFNIYYQKISLISAGSLIIYVKSDPISDDFIIEKDNSLFKDFLRPNEIDLAFRGKEKFLMPKISDCTSFENENNKLTLKIDDLYHDLESFIAVAEPNILFVLDAATKSDPDLLFAFNLMPEMPGKSDKNILKIDMYLDSEHKTKDITYLKREEEFNLIFLNNIKDISHTEIFKSTFSLILHIKSFESPY